MAWDNAVITLAGARLLQGAVEGRTITISGASGGTGLSPEAGLMALSSLEDERQQFPITRAEPVDGGSRLRISISNAGLRAGYLMQQVGIWAEGTLFAVLQDSTGVFVPAEEESPDFSVLFYAVLAVGTQAEIVVNVNPGTASIVADVVIPADGWRQEEAADEPDGGGAYPYLIDISIGGADESRFPSVAVYKSDLAIARAAGLCCTARATDSGIRLWASSRPAGDIRACVSLIADGGGGVQGGIAATDAEVEEMLDEVFGPVG